MSGQTKVWFTSDLHVGHKNIVKFTNRGVDTTEANHDEWLVDLWNSQVAKGDVIYHLGDFSFHKDVDQTIAIIRRLNGVKHFIKGNHDSSDTVKKMQNGNDVIWHQYLERNFNINGKQQTIVMFHFPISSWHKQGYGSWHAFGHTHGNHKDSKGKMLDVGLDSAYNIFGKHQFFTLEMIADYMSNREIYISDHHKEIRA